MGTRYIRSWEELENALSDETGALDIDDDLIFQLGENEIWTTVTDVARRRESASSAEG